MLPVTPTKKALTDDTKNAIDASNAFRNSVVPEDLHVALQNLGSRVRKSVMEGFSTQHLATFTVPPTPHSSPVKLPGMQTTPTPTPSPMSMPIFLSANEAFVSVFPSGKNDSGVPHVPSPKKRTRAEVDLERDENDSVFRNRDVDVDMDARSEVGDAMGQEANTNVNVFNLPRKVKPLRRSVVQARMSAGGASDPFTFAPHDVGQGSPVRDTLMMGGIEMDLSEEAQA